MVGVPSPSELNALKHLLNAILQAYSSTLGGLFEAAVNGGPIEFDRYGMVEDLVDALARIVHSLTVLEQLNDRAEVMS